MSRIHLRYSINRDVNFAAIVNFLVSYNIMTLDTAVSLYKKFKLGEDVTFEIPDEMALKFRDELDSLNCQYE